METISPYAKLRAVVSLQEDKAICDTLIRRGEGLVRLLQQSGRETDNDPRKVTTTQLENIYESLEPVAKVGPLLQQMKDALAKDDLKALFAVTRKIDMLTKAMEAAFRLPNETEPGWWLAETAVHALNLAVLEKERPGLRYNEGFEQLLDSSTRAIELYYIFGQDDSIKRGLSVLEGMIKIEQFGVKARDGKCEEALGSLHDGMVEIAMTWDEGDDGAQQYLDDREPPLAQIDVQLIQEAADSFEKLWSERERVEVRNWDDLASNLSFFADPDYGFPLFLPATEDNEAKVRDSAGKRWSVGQFWVRAMTFAESKLSPDRQWDFVVEYKKTEGKHNAKQLLEHLFFPGMWEQLPKQAKEEIIQAHMLWVSYEESTKDAVVGCLWRATRAIIRTSLWPAFCAYVRSRPIKDKELRDLNFSKGLSQDGREPDLSNFIRDLWPDPRFEEVLGGSGLAKKDLSEVREALPFLETLNNYRNRAEHKGEELQLTLHEVRDAYNNFLGIGHKGILPFLASLQLKR